MPTLVSSEAPAPTTTGRLLDGIHSPADIKALREQDLPQLAQEVRDELIKVLSQTGGHLGPNLGVVELTIALHRVFHTPCDRFAIDANLPADLVGICTRHFLLFGSLRVDIVLNSDTARTE